MPKSSNPFAAPRRRSSAASPFAAFQRNKPTSTTRKPSLTPKRSAVADDHTDRLSDTGITFSLAGPDIPQDVVGLIDYICAHTFEPIPDRAAGMSSERISEILRFRQQLPPIVSLAHLFALSASPTQTERELARLVNEGIVRRLTIPGRGKGGTAAGEGVVLVRDWKRVVQEEVGLEQEVRGKYLALLDAHRDSATAPMDTFADVEVTDLVRAGFLTSPTALASDAGSLFAPPGASSLLNISRAGSTAATGTLAAVGGVGAVPESGGGGGRNSAINPRRTSSHHRQTQTMTFSLPSTGAYLHHLTSSRAHLLSLLRQLSPRHKEATLDLLREKWDGNTLSPSGGTAHAKRARGEWTGVLPGKTKKWREFYGVEFEWVLAECVGSGEVEGFETGSVGIAVRGRRGG